MYLGLFIILLEPSFIFIDRLDLCKRIEDQAAPNEGERDTVCGCELLMVEEDSDQK